MKNKLNTLNFEIVIYIRALFEAGVTKKRVLHLREYAEYVFGHRNLYNIFETNIMSDLSCK
jgi:hypothetical protein